MTTIFSKKDREDIYKKVVKALEVVERRRKFKKLFLENGLIIFFVFMIFLAIFNYVKE